MDRTVAMALLRHALTIVGTLVVAKGWLSPDIADQLREMIMALGSALIAGSAAASVVDKRARLVEQSAKEKMQQLMDEARQ